MTPYRHPPESVCATQGYTAIYYDDSTVQRVRLDQFRLVRDAAEGARRATRCLMPDAQAPLTPLTLDVFGLYGETHAVDLLHVQQVSLWPPAAVAASEADAALYADEDTEREPWQG